MAFNAGAIVAKLKLDSKDYTKGIKGAKADARGLRTELKKNQAAMKKQTVNWKAGGMAAGKLGIAAGGAALAIAGLTRVAKQTFELVAAGAKIRDMEMAFGRLAERAGLASKDIVASVQNITGALSKKQIVESANMLELLGVGMENTAKLTEIARAAGVALGKDVGFMLESIATGTARQSRLWLDNLGIIISIEEANRDYAKTLGKLQSELTDTEQRAAFLNAVLVKGDAIVAAVAGETELASESVGTLAANWANLGDAMKKDISRVGESGPIKFLNKAVALSEILIRNFGVIAAHPLFRWAGKPTTLKELQARARAKHSGGGLGRPPSEMIGAQIQTPAEVQAREAKRAAEIVAAAKKFFDDLLLVAKQQQGPAGLGGFGPVGVGTGVRTGPGGISAGFDPSQPRATIDWAEAADPLDDVANSMDRVNDSMEIGSNLAGDFFSTLVNGAIAGGQGFEKAMMGAIGSVASALGKMIMWGGIGIESLTFLKGAGAIIAGVALMGIGKIMSSRSSGSTSTPYIPSSQITTPRTQEVDKDQRGVTIHVDNFVGDPAWLDNFMRTINNISRSNGYAEVFFNAP